MRAAFVWIGGALFVASLASFAFVYGSVLAESTPPGYREVLRPALVNTAMFTVFAMHHSLMARTGAKAWIRRHVAPTLERSIYVWIASALLIWVVWTWQPVAGSAWEARGPGQWLGYAAQLLGLWLTARAAGLLDPLELAGIRQLQGRMRPVEFKADGPFGLVRHPIYLGWMLMLFGAPVMTMSRLVMAVVSSTYLLLAIPWEERSLVEVFGDRYREYQKRVRWRLIPFLW